MIEIVWDGLPMDEHNRRIAEKNRINESMLGIAIHLGVIEQLGLDPEEVRQTTRNHFSSDLYNKAAMIRNYAIAGTTQGPTELEQLEEFGFLTLNLKEGMQEDQLRRTLRSNIVVGNPGLPAAEQESLAERFVQEIRARRLPILSIE